MSSQVESLIAELDAIKQDPNKITSPITLARQMTEIDNLIRAIRKDMKTRIMAGNPIEGIEIINRPGAEYIKCIFEAKIIAEKIMEEKDFLECCDVNVKRLKEKVVKVMKKKGINKKDAEYKFYKAIAVSRKPDVPAMCLKKK